MYVRRDMVFNEQDFVHGTESMSCRSPPETVEVQQSSDVILKGEEQAKPLQQRRAERIRRAPVRYGIDEYLDAAVEVSSITLIQAFRSSKLKQWMKRWQVIAQRNGSKQPISNQIKKSLIHVTGRILF